MFDQMGIDDIALCGLAKRDEELFVPWQDTGPVVLPSGSASLYLVKQVRDEAHRFAITFHRELRGKGMTATILDDVAGIGPRAQEGPAQALQVVQEPESRHARRRSRPRKRRPRTRWPRSWSACSQQYNRDRKDERVVGGEAGRAEGPDTSAAEVVDGPNASDAFDERAAACPPAGTGPAATWSPAVDEAVRAAVQGREPGREDNEGRTIA